MFADFLQSNCTKIQPKKKKKTTDHVTSLPLSFQDGKTIYDHPASGQRTKEALLRFATAGMCNCWFFFFFFSSIDFYSLEYLKEQGKPTPYDLAVRASGGSIAAARAKANAGGFLEQIEAALPSTIQKAVVRWSDFNVSQMPPHSHNRLVAN